MDQLDCRLRKLRVVSGGKPRLHQVAGDQNRPHLPSAGTPHISGNKALLRGHQPDNCAMLPVAAERAHDCLRFGSHPRGWK